MDLLKANLQDLHLLPLRGLEPLNAGCVAGAGDLTAVVSDHNARTARGLDRVRALIEARSRLADVDLWLSAEGVDIATERSRVRLEAWDALLELARIVEARQVILGRMQAWLQDDWQRANDAHDRAVAAAEKRFAPERRALEKTNPGRVASCLAELIAEDPVVVQAAARLSDARAALQYVADVRYSVVLDSGTLLVCQRRAFEEMVS